MLALHSSFEAHLVVAVVRASTGTTALLLLLAARGLDAGAEAAHAVDDALDEAAALGELHGADTAQADDAAAAVELGRGAGAQLGGAHLLQVAQQRAHLGRRGHVVGRVRQQRLGQLQPVVRQEARRRVRRARRQERRRQRQPAVGPVPPRGHRPAPPVRPLEEGWRWREGLRVDVRLDVDDFGQRRRVQPGRRHDVGALLLLEQQGQPERDLGPVGWSQRRCLAL